MKFLLILLTWFGTVPQMEQEIEVLDLKKCKAQKARIESDWSGAPKEFVGIVVCKKKPKS